MEKIIEWTATVILIIGVALTAWNIYPLNVYFSLAGNFGWFVIGYMWRKWSLITIQLVVTIIYVAGIITNVG
jgi:uncharacterized membrane protein